jgi:hypothetical protein
MRPLERKTSEKCRPKQENVSCLKSVRYALVYRLVFDRETHRKAELTASSVTKSLPIAKQVMIHNALFYIRLRKFSS